MKDISYDFQLDWYASQETQQGASIFWDCVEGFEMAVKEYTKHV